MTRDETELEIQRLETTLENKVCKPRSAKQ